MRTNLLEFQPNIGTITLTGLTDTFAVRKYDNTTEFNNCRCTLECIAQFDVEKIINW